MHRAVVEPKLDGTRAARVDLVLVGGECVEEGLERHASTTCGSRQAEAAR
ncbi:hypothetical protein [Streptomyces yerevanensis]|nr:hypothetical protein [Streptomyces yerevanensis]